MYIEPNTNIRLLKDVPLDNTYKHSIYFGSSGAQVSYFSGKTKYNLSRQTYQRVNLGVSRIGINANNLYDCNYMMFQNSSYGSRWFYAFINSVEYVNDNLTQITFQLDELQSWFFDYDLLPCIIERQHTETDEIGDSLTSEGDDITTYVKSNSYYTDGRALDISPVMNTQKIAVFASSETPIVANGGYIGSTYSAVDVSVFDNASATNGYISGLGATAADRVINITMFPSWVSPNVEDKQTIYYRTLTYNLSEKIGNYTPKNKKLLQYPYNKITVTSPSGGTIDIRPELLADYAEFKFNVYANVAGNPSLYLTPLAYAGSGVLSPNYEYLLPMEGYAKCAFSYSTYAQWLAYNTGSLAASTINTAISGLASGNYLGMATSAISTLGSLYDMQQRPAQVKGSVSGAGLSGAGLLCYQVSQEHIPEELAKIYDDKFTKYGYRLMKLDTPNRTARPHYTYIKTIDCEISGSLPADTAAKICSIYDNGVTFWRNGNEVGNYSVDNTV